MDQTEGPSRTRIRLKRCHLNIDKKFIISDVKISEGKSRFCFLHFIYSSFIVDKLSNRSTPLSYLRKSLVQRPHYSLSDQVIYTFPCKYLIIINYIQEYK